MKMEVWGRHGATKCLIADANNFFIWSANQWHTAYTPDKKCVEPFIPGTWGMGGTKPTDTFLFVDGGRHLKPNASLKDVNATHSINMLFVDGHASSVSPDEAFIAVRGGGTDVTVP